MAVLSEGFVNLYWSDIGDLGEEGLFCALDAGRKWDVTRCLREGGSVIFPHAFIRNCGEQVAAAVHGCLDCGADQVLVLGVDHAIGVDKKETKLREFYGEDLSESPFRGIFEELKWEFSLVPFKALWDAEIKRRGIRGPKLIVRYPSLVNRSPETLPGIKELERIAKDSVMITTGDLCHHGLAYRMSREESLPIGIEGKRFASEKIEESLDVLKTGDYGAFFDHAYTIRNDAKDALSVLRYLKGAQEGRVLDLKLVDTAENFEGDMSPSWVATALVELN